MSFQSGVMRKMQSLAEAYMSPELAQTYQKRERLFFADSDVPTSDLNETEHLFREIHNILNKLTPDNVQKSTTNLINLPINSEDRLKRAIDIIFEKSIDEQVFPQTYAQLCKVLSTIKVPSNAEPSKNVNFRTMLLTSCQKEFDTDYYQEINYQKLIQEVDQCLDEEKKRELKDLAEEKLSKAKRRSLGNIRFVGELFKLGMLTEGIMNDCIERLLKQESDEETIEYLCCLLKTIGKEVEKLNNVVKMKSYFDRLEKIAKRTDSVSARIRFMIQDVIELRSQYGGQNSMMKSSSMVSKAFNLRGQKQTNINMVKKITDVKQITKPNNNIDLLLGPGGGGGGFAWNKAAVPKQSTTDQPSTLNRQTQSASVSSESYERKLFLILQHTNLPSETIFDKIETEFGEIDCQSKEFIRALVTAVCRSCLDAQNKLDPVLFKNRSPVLTKFINRDEDLELDALFAIQALDHKMQHQPAFIRVLFDMFYDEDIISEGVFWKWLKEAREEGHAISTLSLKGFFDWLSEPDPN